jgi:hypothetical protein
MVSSDAAMAVTLFAAVASVAWSATVAWAYWLRHRFDVPPAANTAVIEHDRVARLEAAVDTLSIEIERIGEAQRFAVRLLEERLPAPLPTNARPQSLELGRAITPH